MDNEKRTEWTDADTDAFSADAEAPERYSRSDEEFAAELAEGNVNNARVQQSDNETPTAAVDRKPTRQADQGRAWGITALVLAIAAWFIWPALLGPAAIITGFVAFRQGRRALGSWSIALGLIAFIANIAITPFFR